MADRPWVANGPEDRLSIATYRFLNDTLVPPFYVAMIHDRDGGQRSMLQRTRDVNRGIRKGQLDADVIQGPPYLHRKLELKRGKNDLTEAQIITVRDLVSCGAEPVVAWNLLGVYLGLRARGFRFLPNVDTKLAHYEAQLDAWDREAELILSGAVVKKPAKLRAPRPTQAKLRAVAAVRSRIQF